MSNTAPGPMGAQAIAMHPRCRSCGAALSIEEMHYYDSGDGTATCDACEGAWSDAVDRWRHGGTDDEPPPRP